MKTVQNGKGDRPRNNYGSNWCAGYDTINWHRLQRDRSQSSSVSLQEPAKAETSNAAKHFTVFAIPPLDGCAASEERMVPSHQASD